VEEEALTTGGTLEKTRLLYVLPYQAREPGLTTEHEQTRKTDPRPTVAKGMVMVPNAFGHVKLADRSRIQCRLDKTRKGNAILTHRSTGKRTICSEMVSRCG